jgi:DNA-binding transcriptional regulator WhiA
MTLVLMVQNITLFLLTTILNIYGFILCPINHVFTLSFEIIYLWKTGSTPKSKVYILTMEVNTLLLKFIYLFMALVIVPLLPTTKWNI